MKSRQRLAFLFPLLFSGFAFGAFFRIPGSENVRAVQVVALIGTGMCLGVALAQMFRAMLGPKA